MGKIFRYSGRGTSVEDEIWVKQAAELDKCLDSHQQEATVKNRRVESKDDDA